MFSIFLVFERPRSKSTDSKTSESKQFEVTLADAWFPNPRPNETVDDRLLAEGLPKSSIIAEFCFPRRKNVADDAAGLLPPALPFTFTLTSSQGERSHGFCLRAFKPDLENSLRIDVGGEIIETSVFISRTPYHRLFHSALNICRVRRLIDRPGYLHFLQELHRSTTATSSSGINMFLVDSPTMNVASKYEFSTSKEPRLEPLFDNLTPQMLHYVLGALLLERRIILQAKHERKLSETAYALIQLGCGDVPLRGYPHNFVPILPVSMLEIGLGNPAPYMVGLLKVHLKLMDSLRELGDFVTVDLDSKALRLSSGGAPILPLGIERFEDSISSARNNNSENLNPWLDVCGPFQKDVCAAFQNRDVDLLAASVRAIILLVTVGKLGVHLEDQSIRLFHNAFRSSQIFSAAISALNPSQESSLAVMLGQRGYTGLKLQLLNQQSSSVALERNLVTQTRNLVFEITGASAKIRPDLINKSTTEIAKRTYDAVACVDGIQIAILSKLTDSAGRNWKHGYKALGLLQLLIRTGSEFILTFCWDELAQIFEFSRFSLNGAVGVPSRVVDLVQKRSLDVYSHVVDLHYLSFCRSSTGHVMIQRAARYRMLNSVPKLPASRDFNVLLDMAAPAPVVELDSDEVISSSEVVKKIIPKPPPPPPPPVLQVKEANLLDFDSFLSDSVVPVTLPSTPITYDSKKIPPPPPPPMMGAVAAGSSRDSSSISQSFDSTSSSFQISRADSKLVSAFQPSVETRVDNKLVTAYELPSNNEVPSVARARRPRTDDQAQSIQTSAQSVVAPPRPVRPAAASPKRTETKLRPPPPPPLVADAGSVSRQNSSPVNTELAASPPLNNSTSSQTTSPKFGPPGVKQNSPPTQTSPVSRSAAPPPGVSQKPKQTNV